MIGWRWCSESELRPMHRFFIDDAGWRNSLSDTTVSLDAKLAHQIRDVLHIRVGEQLVLFDAHGQEYICTLTSSNRSSVELQIDEQYAGQPESKVHIILYQGLLKSARFEMILEKGTELGVSTFVPTLCQRSMAGLSEAGTKKVERWQRIIQEATEQCGRTRVPELAPIRTLQAALDELPIDALAIMPWEEEQARSLREILHSSRQQLPTGDTPITIAVFIGPEGGLTIEEVASARQQGVRIATLGPRILRAETAALATVASIMYEMEY
jgi:16S rRNA (uracil1498-N3)-methyltransferase